MRDFNDLKQLYSQEDTTEFKKIKKEEKAETFKETVKETPKVKETFKEKPEIIVHKNEQEISVESIIEKANNELSSLTQEEFRENLKSTIKKIIDKKNISQKEKDKLLEDAFEKMGYGCLEKYIEDDEITEIIVQRFDDIYIEKQGKVERIDDKFESEDELIRIIKKIVHMQNKTINLVHPNVDTVLFDGSRVSACLSPISVDGATMTIRKFARKKLKMEDLLKFNSITPDAAKFLKQVVKSRVSVIISGGTGTGKTTVLNILSGLISEKEMIITIEDTPELQLLTPRVRRLLTRNADNNEKDNIDHDALLKASLRMRPDRIVVGEVRDGSIVSLLSALSTGHDGGFSTVHANSPRNLIDVRLPILYQMNKQVKISEKAMKLQFCEAIRVIVQLERFPTGERKISSITLVDGIDKKGEVILTPIFELKKSVKNGEIEYNLEQVADIPDEFKEVTV